MPFHDRRDDRAASPAAPPRRSSAPQSPAGDAGAGVTANRVTTSPLRSAGSSYLAMHADDPVPWRLWGVDALKSARARRLPLLVSVGFFACAWCRVQHKESFLDPVVAALIARAFVPVKVDREIDSALDARLQAFADLRLGRRGWPLLVLVTPEGRPAEAELYQPRDATLATLRAWAARWRDDPAGVERLARRWDAPAADERVRAQVDTARASALARRFVGDTMRQADHLEGGFGDVAKFPAAPQLLALIGLQPRAGDEHSRDFLRLTLTEMQRWGLRDHVFGGFFRYTTDPGWRRPHFEKMLVDNSLLALVYLRASAALDEPAWRTIALQTLGFMRDELWDDRLGGYATGLAAQDAKGVEGGRHLWLEATLEALLPADEWALIRRLWAVRGAPPFEHGHLALAAIDLAPDEQARAAQALRRLRAARARHRHPRDAKRLAGANGLALAALSEAAPHDDGARRDAEALWRFVVTSLWDGVRLRKLAGSDRAADLDDHAWLAWGLALYAERTGHGPARELGRRVAEAAWRRFYRAGWIREAQPVLAEPVPQPMLGDTHDPSPSALLILASLKLSSDPLRAAALGALAVAGEPGAGAAVAWATHALALDAAAGGR